jgi:hypothetical protein
VHCFGFSGSRSRSSSSLRSSCITSRELTSAVREARSPGGWTRGFFLWRCLEWDAVGKSPFARQPILEASRRLYLGPVAAAHIFLVALAADPLLARIGLGLDEVGEPTREARDRKTADAPSLMRLEGFCIRSDDDRYDRLKCARRSGWRSTSTRRWLARAVDAAS